jgi:hypothetical protein
MCSLLGYYSGKQGSKKKQVSMEEAIFNIYDRRRRCKFQVAHESESTQISLPITRPGEKNVFRIARISSAIVLYYRMLNM